MSMWSLWRSVWQRDMGVDHRPQMDALAVAHAEENGADYAGHNTSRPKAKHLDPAADRSDRYRTYVYHQKGRCINGRDTSPDCKTTGGPSGQQTGYPRMDKTKRGTKLEWGGKTTLFAMHLGPARPSLAPDRCRWKQSYRRSSSLGRNYKLHGFSSVHVALEILQDA